MQTEAAYSSVAVPSGCCTNHWNATMNITTFPLRGSYFERNTGIDRAKTEYGEGRREG